MLCLGFSPKFSQSLSQFDAVYINKVINAFKLKVIHRSDIIFHQSKMNQQLITVQCCLQNLLLGSKQGSATAVNCKQRNKTRGNDHFIPIPLSV